MFLTVAILFCHVRFHVFVLYTMGSRLFVLYFFSRIVHSYVIGIISLKKKPDKFLCDKFLFSFFLTWLGLTNILIYSFWTYWLRDLVSHFMWMPKKKKVCTWSECSWLTLQHCCSRLWFRKIFLNGFPMFLK